MVDIHSHVLPAVDDGARSLDESLDMLRLAAKTGTTDIVATPHANAEFPYDRSRIEDIYRLVRDKAKGIINVHLASDFHLSYENLLRIQQDPFAYTINNHQYLMLELPDLLSFSIIRDGLTKLSNWGIVPVITHPERNISLQQDIEQVESFVRLGALIQVTAQSFTGRFGPVAKHAADSLLNAKMVHFVASDAHDCVDRSPDLSAAFRYVLSTRNRREAELLFIHNPAATLVGDPLPKMEQRGRKMFSWFSGSKSH